MPKIKTHRQPETREVILEAFIGLVEERGAFQIVFQDIADASKMSLGSIRYYFKTYENLVEAAIAFVFQNAQVFIEEDLMRLRLSGQSNQMVRSYVEANFKWMAAFPAHASFLSYFYHLCCTQASVQGRDFWQRGRMRIEALLLEEIARTKSKGPESIQEAARLIHNLIFGAIVSALAERSEQAIRAHRENLIKYLPDVLEVVAKIGKSAQDTV